MTRPAAFVSNPSWVTEIIASSYETLEDTIPANWLPRLVDLGASGERIDAQVVEYGCGVYGCVIPTVDNSVVLKLTTDETEAEFAADFAADLVAPVCVKYHMVIKTRAKHDGNRVYLLWRDSADHVGKMVEVLGKEAAAYVRRQHRAGQMAFEAASNHPTTVARFAAMWVRSCAAMVTQTKFPDLQPLGAGLIKVWEEQRIIFGDIHEGNLGVVNGRWVITDPGNIAVVSDILPEGAIKVTAPADVILRAEPTGRPSKKRFMVSGVHVPFTGEVVSDEQAVELLHDAMPPGFEPGPYLQHWLGFSVIRGIPEHNHPNTVYITTPSELLGTGIYGDDLYAANTDVVSDAWASGRAVPAIAVEIPPDGSIYVTEGNETLQLAAIDNRTVAVVVKEFDPGWRPPEYIRDISQRIAQALPTPLRANTRMSSLR
jgi:hypothetical protein